MTHDDIGLDLAHIAQDTPNSTSLQSVQTALVVAKNHKESHANNASDNSQHTLMVPLQGSENQQQGTYNDQDRTNSAGRLLHNGTLARDCQIADASGQGIEVMAGNGPINPERVLGQIAARLKAIEHIEITDDTDGQKHYGYKIGVGNNTLSALWHCTDDRTHPDHARYAAEGGDVADLYCDSHYPTVDDDAMLAFLLNAKQDIASLLSLIRQQQAALERVRVAQHNIAARLKNRADNSTGSMRIGYRAAAEWILEADDIRAALATAPAGGE